mgnify:CR=1 FL=1
MGVTGKLEAQGQRLARRDISKIEHVVMEENRKFGPIRERFVGAFEAMPNQNRWSGAGLCALMTNKDGIFDPPCDVASH